MTATAYESTRQLDSNFYTDGGSSDRSIKQMMEASYNQHISQTQAFWNEARIDQRFVAGDQSLWNEIYSNLPSNRRRQFSFNKIRRIVNMIGGHQRKNRKSTIIQPIEGADEETANQFTELLSWTYQRDNIYNTISDAFESGALVSGFSLLSLWLDYSLDPSSGDLRCSHLSYNSYILDNFFRKQDLSDCSFIWTRKWVTNQEASLLIPEREKEIKDMRPPRYGTKDQRFYFMPENYNLTTRNLLPYDEFWYQSTRKQKLLVDTKTGETMEWTADKERLDMFLATYPEVKVQTITRPTVRMAIVLNDKVMYDGPNPLGIDRYPFVPVVGYWDPDQIYAMWRFQGVVRGLRDSQFLYNRRKAIELDMLESQINSGMKVMEGSLVDNNDVLKSGQGQPIFIKSSAPLGMQSVEQIQPPQVPPTTMQLSQLLSQEMQEISGINEELLGSATDDKAGILSMLRQGAGLVTLEKLFDQLDLSQKILGEITQQIIQQNWTFGKVKRILGKEPTPQFLNKAFQRFDSTVAEGLLTETQRKTEFIQYMNLQQMGLPIPPDILIDKAPIQGKKELKEAIAKIQEAQQKAEQQTQQLQMQAMQVENETKASFSEAQHALAAERFAKVQEERTLAQQQMNKAEEEKTAATLNLVKALKELEGMDLEQLMQKVQILKILSEETNEEGASQAKEKAPSQESLVAPQG
jgi:hypothetical protein